jgi:hypothetical protein
MNTTGNAGQWDKYDYQAVFVHQAMMPERIFVSTRKVNLRSAPARKATAHPFPEMANAIGQVTSAVYVWRAGCLKR